MNINFRDLTIAVLRDHRPDMVAEIAAEARAPVEKERDEAAAKAKTAATSAESALNNARRKVEAAKTAAAAQSKPAQSEPASPYSPEALKAEWLGSDKLKAEFPEAEDYAAYRKGDAEGRFKVLHGKAAA